MTTTYSSNQYANQIAVLKDAEPTKAYTRFFNGVTATADTGTLNLLVLPPGKIRIYPYGLSGFLCANMAEGANISIGLSAYTAANGAAVAAAVDALMAAALVNTAVLANAPTLMANVANGGLLVESMSGVTVTATVTDAATAANGTFSGWLTYSVLS